MIFGGGGGRDDDRNPIGELLLIFLAPIAAMLLRMAISRSREYQADRTAARLIGDGEPLAQALGKLDRTSKTVPSLASPNQAQMYIANPLASPPDGLQGPVHHTPADGRAHPSPARRLLAGSDLDRRSRPAI